MITTDPRIKQKTHFFDMCSMGTMVDSVAALPQCEAESCGRPFLVADRHGKEVRSATARAGVVRRS
ncbi:hypothetical protein JD76_05730 [Micromonospora endolithica]|nr:hypothetical protein JD76_05730 [Micromonospora endolithica]